MNDKDNIIILFIALFVIYYMSIVIKDYKGLFFIIILFIIIYTQSNTLKTFFDKNNINTKKLFTTSSDTINNILSLFLDKKEKEINDNKNGIEEDIYYIRNPLKNIKFIKNSDEITNELLKLQIIEKYDNDLFNKIIYLLEHFLRLHYKIMMEFYSFEQYFNTLKDLRSHLLNSIKSIVYIMPKANETLINDIFDNIEGITHRYIKILQLKYKKTHLTETAPHEYDPYKDNKFNIF